jgi:hypothetical protein
MFITEDQFTKHTNITTIYSQYFNQKLFTKDNKNAKLKGLGLVD